MQELGMNFGLIVLGAAFIFFVKGVWEVRTTPNDFRFMNFVSENSNRLYLLAFGLVVTALILYLDPAGLGEIAETLPLGVQLGSPLVAGAGLAGMVLAVPRKGEQ